MSEDSAYLNGAMLLLDVEQKFDLFAVANRDTADEMVTHCLVQLDTIRPFDQPPTPACGALGVVGYLARMGMIDDDAATLALVYVGAMQRAERIHDATPGV